MVRNLFQPNEFVFVFPALILDGFIKAHLRRYSCTTKRKYGKAMPRQIIVDEMPATSDDTPSEETGDVGN